MIAWFGDSRQLFGVQSIDHLKDIKHCCKCQQQQIDKGDDNNQKISGIVSRVGALGDIEEMSTHIIKARHDAEAKNSEKKTTKEREENIVEMI